MQATEVRPVPSVFRADAESICEAVLRPKMRFVTVKSEETQGTAVVFRVRALAIRRRTQTIDVLRGYSSEVSQVVPRRH